MSDLSGPSAVGIETVEWSAEPGGNLAVRITGRWRRRRPITTGQPTLVIEADGRRHRYPAMPEPPSLAGTGPGVWRLSFTVPGWMAPDLGRTWLQFGTVIVPLPVAVPAPGERQPIQMEAAPAQQSREPPPAEVTEPGAQGPHAVEPERDADAGSPRSSPSPRPVTPGGQPTEAGTTVSELASRMAALERELRAARAGRDELAASLADRDRSRRIAEQRAHAEQALRQDLARQLNLSAREAERTRQAMGDLAAAEERIRGLERELAGARRRSDEAEQVAAAATVARERADGERTHALQALAQRAEPAAAETARLHFEAQLRGRRAQDAVWIPAEPIAAAPAPPPPPLPVPGPPSPPPPAPEPLAPAAVAPAPAAGSDGLVTTLRQELASRTRADAAVRARLIDAEARLAARILLEQRTTDALAQVRAELDTLRDALVRERALRAAADLRAAELERELEGQRALSRDAYDAIGELRGALDRLAAPQPEPAAVDEPAAVPPPARARPEPEAIEPQASEPHASEPQASEPQAPQPEGGLGQSLARLAPPASPEQTPSALVEPARLNDALTRLRGTIAPQEAPAAAGTAVARPPSLLEALGRPTLEGPFRKLVRADADAAGRLVLELLPLQRVVYPHSIAYDLVVGAGPGRGCVSVTVTDGTATIAVQSTPRPRDSVDFQVYGEPARIARLLTAGRWRRRFSRRVARVRGRREGVAALSALLGTPLDLKALHDAGVRLDPATAFSLVASMIDPAWTVRERFTLAHVGSETATTYMIVSDGRPIEVTRTAPEGRITATLSGTADHLLAALSGQAVSGLTVTGDGGALTSLRQWIKRAQSE
jgi:hypothetical protein